MADLLTVATFLVPEPVRARRGRPRSGRPQPWRRGGRRGRVEELPRREGVLFANSIGGRIDINNWRSREWVPALQAAGVEHRRIYDMRHTFATWSLAAGMSIFTLSRRMGHERADD